LNSYDNKIILIKLKSGYNIGLMKENILDYRVIKKFKEEKQETEFEQIKGLPKVGLIVTGGTIASKLDSRTGGVSALTEVSEFRRIYPHFFEKVNIEKIEIPFMELSENMSSHHWKEIAKIVKKMLDDKELQGVIITHGSDTLHYTAAALSFFLKDLNKPVVLTFSQRSIDRGSSDADFNLVCAAQFALSDCAEVCIVGHANTNDEFCYALQGTKVRKMHTSRRDTFKPINTKPLAKVWSDKVEFISNYRPRNGDVPELDDSFNDKVALVKFYPGQKPEILDYYFQKGYKGLIIEMTGLGHVSVGGKNSWLVKLKKLIKEGLVVCATAQTVYGRLNQNVYSTGRELEKIGVIPLEDMLSETAFVKLGWVLGHKSWSSREKIKNKMLENVSGEFNELLTE